MSIPYAQEREDLLQGRSFLLKDTFWKLNPKADGSDVRFSRAGVLTLSLRTFFMSPLRSDDDDVYWH